MRSPLTWRLLPFVTALLIGVVAGTIADSGIVAGLAALMFAAIWDSVDRGSDGQT
ncbi:MAG: hypothetical protein QOG15_1104 [Solirubrobacteraceae bacterium]|jgi:hypothetical protein|nr:hypothetical protein [Solirubrobacteraceae bacterium]